MKSFRTLGSREVVALLLAATTINYIDRQALSVLAPVIQRELLISSLQYSYAVNAFLIVYSPMYFVMGRVLDRLGTRWGLTLAVIWWSLAETLHGAVVGIKTLCLFRAMLAIGEAAIIPAGVKAVAEWCNPKQRGLAIGVFETGMSLGPVLAPPIVVWIALRYSWREAFVWTGIVGLIWAISWMVFYRPRMALISSTASAEELSDAPAVIKWGDLFRSKSAWAVGLGRFFGDPIWYFYLFWLPKYLADSKGLSVMLMGELAWIPYVGSLLGSLSGGAFSSWLVKRGAAPVKARIRALSIGTIMVTSGAFSVYLSKTFWVMSVISLGAFALQFWGGNLDTLPTDLFPSHQVGQVVGFGGLMGAIGGVIFTAFTGYAVTHYSYTPVWIVSGMTYPLGLLIMYLLLRKGHSSSRELNQYKSVADCIE
jgi:ACS family hexuronate transporter-like MFS transporter